MPQLAEKVRAKFPGVYDDLDDATLERQVLAKYPDYKDLAARPPGPATIGEQVAHKGQYGTLANLGIGAAKGAGQSFVNLGKAVQSIPGVKRGVDALYSQPGLSDAAMQQADRDLAPVGTAQHIGKFGEQIAEMIVPGRVIQRAGMAAASKLAPVVGRILPRAVVEGAGAAGMSAVQGGDPLTGAVLGAAAPVVSSAIGRLPQGLKDAAQKKVVQALGPAKERYKAIAARLAPDILKRGLSGSREALQQKAATTLEVVGDQLDGALAQFGPQVVVTQPILSALETAKDAFRTVNRAGKVVEFEPRAIKQLSGLQTIISDLGQDATVEQLTAVRRAWDKVVSQAGGYAQRAGGAIGVPLKDQSEAFAKREGAGAIRQLLAAEVPDLAAINKEFSFWKNLDDVLTQTLQRTQPQGPGLGRQVAQAGAQAAGAVMGSGAGPAGAVGGAIGLGAVAKMANTVFTSPRWRLVDAKLRDRLADAIVSGNASRIAGTLGQIGAVQGSKVPSALTGATPR